MEIQLDHCIHQHHDSNHHLLCIHVYKHTWIECILRWETSKDSSIHMMVVGIVHLVVVGIVHLVVLHPVVELFAN